MLIEVSAKQDLSLFSNAEGQLWPEDSRHFIRKVFGPVLPPLAVGLTEKYFIASGRSANSIRVTFRDYGEDDLNVPDLEVRIHFSDSQDSEAERQRISHVVETTITELFDCLGVKLPGRFDVVLIWASIRQSTWVNGAVVE